MLTHSTPHRAQTVETAPPAVQFDFNEPVEVSFGAVRVYDENGERVDEGEITRPEGASNKVAVRLRDGLGDGVYTGTYRVVSADGHPVSGGFSFGVGEALPTGGSAPSVADLLEESDAGPEVEGTYGVVRGLHYAALLFLIGCFAAVAFFWPRVGLPVAWPRGWVIAAAALGLVCALIAIGLQGALGAGVGLGQILDRTIIDGSLDTRSGEAWAIRASAWLVLLILVATAPRRPQRWLIALAGATLAVVAVSMPLAGHADTHSPEGLLVTTDLVHLLAAGIWLGGLVTLLAPLLAPGRRTCHWRRHPSDPQLLASRSARHGHPRSRRDPAGLDLPGLPDGDLLRDVRDRAPVEARAGRADRRARNAQPPRGESAGRWWDGWPACGG